jgi:glycosyltransferase involved in cell wall biosynthesis
MITVVICTHNRSSLLLQTIDSLNRATKPAGFPVEILVIANACRDSTVEKLERYIQSGTDKQLRLNYQEEPVAGKSYALNRAIHSVKEGFLCFIDDDQKADKNFLIAIEIAIESHQGINIFCGKLLPDWTGNEPKWVHETGQYKVYPFPIPIFDLGDNPIQITLETAHPPGGNLFVHHSVFETVGEFSTELGPSGHNLAGSEDSDFILRALNKEVAIQYIPDIVQYHYVDEARLKLGFLIKMSYQRTRTLTQIKTGHSHSIPRYLWRKLAEYVVQGLFSLSWQRTRFFSMRVASTLGEIAGFMNSGRS